MANEYEHLTGDELNVKSGGSYAGEFVKGTAKNTFMDTIKGAAIGAAVVGGTVLLGAAVMGGLPLIAVASPLIGAGVLAGGGLGGVAGAVTGLVSGGAREVIGESQERDEIREKIDRAVSIAEQRGKAQGLEQARGQTTGYEDLGTFSPDPVGYGQGQENGRYF